MTSRFEVYTNNRPVRIALILDTQSCTTDALNQSMRFLMDKWGGRYNPIILTDDGVINEDALKFLATFDPDVVEINARLGDESFKELCEWVNPIEMRIEKPDADRYNPGAYHHYAPIYPSQHLIDAITGWHGNDAMFCTFKLAGDIDPHIRSFISCTFGDFPFSRFSSSWFTNMHHREYEINGMEDLERALRNLRDMNRKVVFPSQLSAYGGSPLRYTHSTVNSDNVIVVGESAADAALAWNMGITHQKIHTLRLLKFYVPKSLMEDEGFKKAFSHFLDGYAVQNQQGTTEYSFLSKTISEEDLKKYYKECGFQHSRLKNVGQAGGDGFELFEREYFDHSRLKNLDYHALDHSFGQIEVSLHGDNGIPSTTGSWFTDIHIKHRASKYEHISGRDWWCKLPPHNALARRIISSTARVNLDGFLSAPIQGRMGRVPVNILDDRSLFSTLFGDRKPHVQQADPRITLDAQAEFSIKSSDKGKYLSGLIDIFGDIDILGSFLETRFWRDIMHRMSKRTKVVDERYQANIRSKIQKVLPPEPQIPISEKQYLSLVELVLRMSREMSVTQRELCYGELKSLAKKELATFNESLSEEKHFNFDEDDFLQTMDELIELEVFLSGVIYKCRNCGTRNWMSMGNASQSVICPGCHHSIFIAANPEVYYRLNTLVRTTLVDQGQLPVALILYQLMMDSRNSFAFVPPVDLIIRKADKHITDIDICALVDGKLVIGEVKEQSRWFKKSDFDTMSQLIEYLNPDRVIFSAMESEPDDRASKKIDKLQQRYPKVNITWYGVRKQAFEPEPYF